MKKTCANCKSLGQQSFPGDLQQKCELNYRQKIGKLHKHGTWFELTIMAPAEECPKPTTNNQWIKAEKKREK